VITRRKLMLSALAVGGLPALTLRCALQQKATPEAASDAAEWRNRQSGVSYRRLGRTNYMISEVVMGGNTISPDNHEHVLMAIDQGLNYLDTAPAYGRGASESGYARVLKARPRDKVFLNSKVSLWDLNRNQVYRDIYDSLSDSEKKRVDYAVQERLEATGAFREDYIVDYFARQRGEVEDATLADVMASEFGHKIDRDKNYKQVILDSVEESLKRLGTDYLDLLMCPHGVSTDYEMRAHPEIFDAFEVLKRDGKVRHFGISSHSAPSVSIEAAIDMKVYSAAMVAYNVVNDPHVRPALERAHRDDFGVIAMKVARPVHPGTYGRDALPGRAQLMNEKFPGPLKLPQKAYLWALSNPNLTAVISEMQNAEIVNDNMPLAAAKDA
jgi:aryl-alcohol dehydrogenase-like predicted oxidoreductase